MSLTDTNTMTAPRGAMLPLSLLAMTRTATSSPASADAELIALGKRFAPLFARWRRQTAAAQASMAIVAAREKLYRETDRVHAQASDLIDEILSLKATTAAGFRVQVQAALVDFDPDALFLDPDPRHRGFFESLCALTSIDLPPCWNALATQ
jgi:hypothetical protein